MSAAMAQRVLSPKKKAGNPGTVASSPLLRWTYLPLTAFSATVSSDSQVKSKISQGPIAGRLATSLPLPPFSAHTYEPLAYPDRGSCDSWRHHYLLGREELRSRLSTVGWQESRAQPNDTLGTLDRSRAVGRSVCSLGQLATLRRRKLRSEQGANATRPAAVAQPARRREWSFLPRMRCRQALRTSTRDARPRSERRTQARAHMQAGHSSYFAQCGRSRPVAHGRAALPWARAAFRHLAPIAPILVDRRCWDHRSP